MAIETGNPAPPFSLRDAHGKLVSLADLKGQDVILYFYPKDDTPGCTKEACGFRDDWAELRRRGVRVIGVSPDDAASHHAFAEKYKLPFELLSDPGHQTMEAYGAWGEKTSYGKTTIGVLRSTVWIGPDGRVKKHWPKVADA